MQRIGYLVIAAALFVAAAATNALAIATPAPVPEINPGTVAGGLGLLAGGVLLLRARFGK
jgi:hypothetical protein